MSNLSQCSLNKNKENDQNCFNRQNKCDAKNITSSKEAKISNTFLEQKLLQIKSELRNKGGRNTKEKCKSM